MRHYSKNVLSITRIDELEKKYSDLLPTGLFADDPHYTPFQLLILAILSQNTTETNSNRAYKRLEQKFRIEPGVLKNANEREISQAIKIGGIHKIKARRIRIVSKEITVKYNGTLSRILALPRKEAKKQLTALSGVGNKTADIVLADQYSYRDVIPIDTHMERVAKRLGLVRENAAYDEIQTSLMRFIPASRRARTARLLWLMAKHTCRARNPCCTDCVLTAICMGR